MKLSKQWLLPLCLIAGHRIIVWLMLVVSIFGWGDIDRRNFEIAMQSWPRTGGPVFLSHFATWDTAHYLHLSEEGYAAGDPSCAFYPLWPHWIRWTAPNEGAWHLVVGTIWANLFSFIAIHIFYRVVLFRYGDETAKWAMVMLLVYPGTLFFMFHYSESLFFVLLMILCWACQHQRLGWATAAAFLLPLTRSVGVFAVVPLTWGMCGKGFSRHNAWVVIAPILGWGGYLLWMQLLTGNPWEGFEAQRFWSVNSISNLFQPAKFLSAFAYPLVFHDYYGSVLDRTFWLLFLWSLPFVWGLDREWFWWVLLLGIVPGVLSSLVSFMRYSVMAFPVFVLWGAIISRSRYGALRWLVVAVMVAIQVSLSWRHVNFLWAG